MPRSSITRSATSGARTPITRTPITGGTRGGLATPPPWPSPILPPGPVGEFPPLQAIVYEAQPALTVPSLLQVKSYPSMDGQEVIRINPLAGQGQRYSCPMAWNSNASLIFLDYPPGGSGTARPMLDGMTFAQISAAAGTTGNFRWHPVLPYVGFGYANPNSFRRYDISPSTGLITLDQAFTLSQYSEFNYTGGQGRPSNDGRYHPYTFKKSNNDWGFGILDAGAQGLGSSVSVEERVCGNSTAALGTLIDCSYMSWDGLYTIPMFEFDGAGSLQGTWSWPRGQLSSTAAGVKLSQNNSHADAGALTNGVQVMFQASQAANGSMNGQPVSGGYVGYYRLDNGAWTRLLSGYANAHISTANINVPGYGILSNFSSSGTQPGFRQVIAVEFASGLGRVYGFTHKATGSGYNYETQASVSPDMTRVVFRSDWDGGAIGCFVAGMDVARGSILP